MKTEDRKVLELIERGIEKASEITSIRKYRHYGDPKGNHERIGVLLDAYLSIRRNNDSPITPEQSIAIEILKKIARIEASPKHEDSWVDIIGYGACGYSVAMRDCEDDGLS